jgi:hypothetical protein
MSSVDHDGFEAPLEQMRRQAWASIFACLQARLGCTIQPRQFGPYNVILDSHWTERSNRAREPSMPELNPIQ